MAKQLQFDFSKVAYAYNNGYTTGKIKQKVQSIIGATVKRINREKDPDKKWKYKIIKHEFQKLRDDLA
jgi:hypothetical protein